MMWHLRTLRQFDIAALKRDDPIDTLREWSVRYGMANPDDLDLVRDVLTDLSVYLRLQQKGLGQDALHCLVEVGEDQP